MKPQYATLIMLGALAACGGGDHAPACVEAFASGPFTSADLVAVVDVSNLSWPAEVRVTAVLNANKQAEQLVKIGFSGDAFEMMTLKLRAGEVRSIALSHTFSGVRPNPAYAYFGTLAVGDNGDHRAYVTDVHVQACGAP